MTAQDFLCKACQELFILRYLYGDEIPIMPGACATLSRSCIADSAEADRSTIKGAKTWKSLEAFQRQPSDDFLRYPSALF